MAGGCRQGHLLCNELEMEEAPESKSFPWLRCVDQIWKQEPRQARYQREMSDGDLTERHKEGEEKGVERNVGGVGRGIVDQPRARPQGSAAGSPTPKVFSYGIHFNMGPRKS